VDPRNGAVQDEHRTQKTATRYRVDEKTLLSPEDRVEDIALATDAELCMVHGLVDEHWRVIRYLRDIC